MKKFSTLLMALVMVLSATAANLTEVKVAQKEQKVNPVAKNGMQLAAARKVVAEDRTLEFGDQEPNYTYYASDGDWYFGCVDNSNTYVVRLDYVVGEDGKFGTYDASVLDMNYSFFSDYTTGERVDKAYVAEGLSFSFTETEWGYRFDATLPCEDGNTYYCSGEWFTGNGNECDMQDEDVEAAFTTNDIQTLGYNDENTTPYWYFQLNNGDEVFSCVIYSDNEETLPAGTYPINSSDTLGSAQAGSTSGSTYHTSFYGKVNEDGYIGAPLYLCVGGTVVVSYTETGDLELEVNAINSWGRTAHITLTAPTTPTGVESAECKAGAVKNIRNGQLVIIRDGKRYNVLGAEL